MPLFSVILPVYNGGKYLKEAVESVLVQDHHDFEFIVLDDCSSDGSYEYLQTISDQRFTLMRNDRNRGLFYNLNKLVEASSGELVKLWSQDDIMYPHCLSRMKEIHEKYPQVGFSYSQRDIIDENGTVSTRQVVDNTPELISTDLHALISFFTGSIAGNIANVCISKKALVKVGPFREDMKISADFDMWVRLAEHHPVGFTNEKLIQLRDHTGQLSRKESLYYYHVKEDMEVFRYLLGYVSPELRVAGKRLLRKHKYVFYYTLMTKAFLKGDFKNARKYFKELSRADNILLLTLSFIRGKISPPGKPAFLK